MGGTGGTESYQLDAAGRLTSVAYADGTTIDFTYDAAGNRTSMTSGGSTTSYSYDAASQLTSAGSVSYAYDPAGNRIAAGSASFGYDDFGNLASATAGASAVTYTSNGDGLRVSATSGGSTSSYLWDQAAGLPSLLSDGTSGFLSADATLLAETSASSSAYPITDALGSVRALTDSSGSLTSSASYDVFGSVRSSSGSVGSLGYTGALSDSSGLVYLQARSLDPASGTFTSRDPLTPGGPGITGFNPYAYAGQNPTTYSDPGGRDVGVAGRALNLAAVAVRTIPSIGWFGRAVVGLVTIDGVLLGCILTRACALPLPWPDETDEPRPPDNVIPFPKAPEQPVEQPNPEPRIPPIEVPFAPPKEEPRTRQGDCELTQAGSIFLQPLDSAGRATGADAILTPVLVGGSKASYPEEGYGNGLDRGHLVAKILGGSGSDPRNIIPMYRYANRTRMRTYEGWIRAAVLQCQVVLYRVRPHYTGSDPIPTSVSLFAVGTKGFSLQEDIDNP